MELKIVVFYKQVFNKQKKANYKRIRRLKNV